VADWASRVPGRGEKLQFGGGRCEAIEKTDAAIGKQVKPSRVAEAEGIGCQGDIRKGQVGLGGALTPGWRMPDRA
jgi:hypothetical protein